MNRPARLDQYRLRPGAHLVTAQLYLPSEENQMPTATTPAPNLSAVSAIGDGRATGRAYLACPDCDRAGQPGRIGSRRTDCRTCNRWGQGVRIDERRRALAALDDAERQRVRAEAELAVYQRLILQPLQDAAGDRAITEPGAVTREEDAR